MEKWVWELSTFTCALHRALRTLEGREEDDITGSRGWYRRQQWYGMVTRVTLSLS